MHAADQNIPDFRQSLKTVTQPLHDALEKSPLAQSLASGTVNLSTYKTYLSKLYTLHAYCESEVAAFAEWGEYGIDPDQRRRLPMLIDDLNALGINPSDLPLSFHWNHTWDFPTAVGVMYVLEGSTMGGMYLAQRLLLLTGHDGQPATRYFRGYGDETIPMWSDYCRFLNQYAYKHPDEQSKITDGACAMFTELQGVLNAFD